MAVPPLHLRNRLQFRGLRHVARTATMTFGMLVALIVLIAPTNTVRAQDATSKPFKPVTGGKFDEALQQPLGITWTEEGLRAGLRKLAETRQVSILLDRRIDAETKVSLDIQRASLREILEHLTKQVGLGMSIVSNTIYIGPTSTANRLRTAIELQANVLIDSVGTPNKPVSLLQKRSLEWSDFDRPEDILTKISKLFGFNVEGFEVVPHDLWPSGSIAGASSTEMLMLVTAQFDLGIEWQSKGASVRIVPLPESVSVERHYEVKTKPTDIAAAWQAEFPNISITTKGAKLSVNATVEQHEFLAASLRVSQPTPMRTAPSTTATKTVSFTFEIKAAPLVAVMQAVESKSNFVFAYDADELKAAGVDLNRKLDLKMTKASLSELLRAMFDTSQIAFEIDGNTVRLKPAKSM